MLLSTSRALPHTLRAITRSHTAPFSNIRRSVSTLTENPHIYIHPPSSSSPQTHTLTLLPTTPPTPSLSLGTTTTLPITPQSFTPNPQFLPFLSTILQKYAHLDPQLHSQAAAFATTTTHFSLSPPSSYRQNKGGKSAKGKDSGAPPSASQGGAGSGGHGGYIHLSDTRAPPDYGRIAYPEDIFGSLEVDATGQFVEGDSGKAPGNWQDSGTYRIVTREGIFGLPDFLRGKLVEALKEEEKKINGN
ncbi:uncharacterized protein EAF01_010240 [Botrytis porri]|uniref:Uncharacterized protein n=1 Tax=Botrytis porri TaxID=87229 RepID=A0A4Z1KID8_9HELO|nr:uncharacterized protein EAF01_010240 [Botrytis porri]KAF7892160.1 hypothetical protein EAF01_010240 [Botrytis porri]TGO83992.1 hypothetical protein BPOR_0565g00030 [Botrytis porri]